jgi:hypothetical protein
MFCKLGRFRGSQFSANFELPHSFASPGAWPLGLPFWLARYFFGFCHLKAVQAAFSAVASGVVTKENHRKSNR